MDLLEATATRALDPDRPGRRSRDAGDDYLLALAMSASAVVVSGDRDLLDLGGDFPIYSPLEFLATLDD
jgi:predicted nucleic acid-binding protein